MRSSTVNEYFPLQGKHPYTTILPCICLVWLCSVTIINLIQPDGYASFNKPESFSLTMVKALILTLPIPFIEMWFQFGVEFDPDAKCILNSNKLLVVGFVPLSGYWACVIGFLSKLIYYVFTDGVGNSMQSATAWVFLQLLSICIVGVLLFSWIILVILCFPRKKHKITTDNDKV